jgi:hypothetical protein
VPRRNKRSGRSNGAYDNSSYQSDYVEDEPEYVAYEPPPPPRPRRRVCPTYPVVESYTSPPVTRSYQDTYWEGNTRVTVRVHSRASTVLIP